MSLDHRTPKLTAFDPRGLAVRSVDYCRSAASEPAQRRVNRRFYDGAGRVAKQWDPRLWALLEEDGSAPANLSTVYSLSSAVLQAVSVDAGLRIDLPGLSGEGLLSLDGRGTQREVKYDDLLRPLAAFEQGAGEPLRCVERMKYGRAGQGSDEHNQYGQLIRHDDPAGTVWFESFSLTGQTLGQRRRFTLDPVTPDWPEREDDREPLLEPGDGAVSTWRFGPQGDVLELCDARGHQQRQRLTLDGRVLSGDLRLKDQSEWQPLVSDIHYGAHGQIERETAGNGVTTALTYSPEDGRLMERQAWRADGEVLQHLLYAYDPMGNVLRIEDRALPVRYFANQRIDPISRFSYDSLYQLIEATGWEAGGPNQGPGSVGRSDPAAISNYRQTFRYDAGGNLLELIHVGAQSHGRQISAARFSNRCLPYRNGVPPTEAQIAAAFDACGNLLELGPGRILAWDLRNQLASVTPVERASGRNDRETYVYDGSGQRVRKFRELHSHSRNLTADVRYLPGLELHTDTGTSEKLHVVIAEAGLNSVRILHWDSPPSGTNDQYRYGFTDHLGSVGLELTADTRIISREVFYPFGETAWLEGDDVEVSYKTVRYSGKERDATGLYYYGYRYYIPWLQRWLNPDPAGNIDGLNLYAMVVNNPVIYRDASGLNKTGEYEIEIGFRSRLKLMGAAHMSKILVFEEETGKYKAVDDFKVVEVGAVNDYLVGGDEVKENLRHYKQLYKNLANQKTERPMAGQPSNFGLGADISGYMLRSANDVFIDDSTALDSGNRHPDLISERRFFATMKRSDKNRAPEQRQIYGLVELNTSTEKGKTDVDIVQMVVHPETQDDRTRINKKSVEGASGAQLSRLKGVGTFLAVHSMKAILKGANVKKIRTEALNPRSARIAIKFGAKHVVKR